MSRKRGIEPQVMSEDHPRFDDFSDQLEEALAGDAAAACHRAWKAQIGVPIERLVVPQREMVALANAVLTACKGGKPKAAAVLLRMGGLDVRASLDLFARERGVCDCTIYFHVCVGPEAADVAVQTPGVVRPHPGADLTYR